VAPAAGRDARGELHAVAGGLGPEERVWIPYQPTFLEQIREDNVRSISTSDGSVQGN
jgi:hypothetical protein